MQEGKMVSLNEKLENEKEKLHRLANEALKKGIPLTQDEKFMAQNHKVDELVVKIQIKKSKPAADRKGHLSLYR